MDDADVTIPAPAPARGAVHGGEAGLETRFDEVRALLQIGMTEEAATSDLWQPPSAAELESQIPPYSIAGLLGRGGMGAVYKGWQKSLERFVAIKIMPPALHAADLCLGDRFRLEARAMAKFKHPAIVPVFDAGETPGGLLYFVMELVEGTDVQKIIAAEGRLPPWRALGIILHVCDALAYAHNAGVIHRDIKPSNIMLDTDGRVKVTDFGLAKFMAPNGGGTTRFTSTMGTSGFMAPETLVAGGKIDARSDLFSVGATLYQMLTGILPLGHCEPPSGLVRGLDPGLDGVIWKAMHADREKRYASADDLRRDIERSPSGRIPHGAEGLVVMAPRPSMAAASNHGRIARFRAWMLPALGAVAAAVAFAGWWIHGHGAARPSRDSVASAPAAAAPAAPWVAAGPREKPFVNTLGMVFVGVPGTGILMCIHETRKADYAAYAAATPSAGTAWKNVSHDGVPVSDGDDHPVAGLSWEEATAFCAWLSAREGRVYRLPTDREWSMAVGLGVREAEEASPDALNGKIKDEYPWGVAWPPPEGAGNFADDAHKEKFPGKDCIEGYHDGWPTTAPVMSFAPNRLGIYDLGGNVWEWCQDWYDQGRGTHVLRGGGYESRAASWTLLSSHRASRGLINYPYVGFRCVTVAAP